MACLLPKAVTGFCTVYFLVPFFKCMNFNIVDQKAETAKLNGSHCGSAPNLASKEDQKTKAKGLRKFLGKMKRSSSGHFHEESKKSHQSLDRTSLRRPTPSYSRGSEGSRFSGWMNGSNSFTEPEKPFLGSGARNLELSVNEQYASEA